MTIEMHDHDRNGSAELNTPGGTDSVANYGDVAAEYAAIGSAAAMVDRSTLGRVVQRGADAIDLLHRLTTSNIESLEIGESRLTILASEKGKIVALFTVVRQSENDLLLLASGKDRTALIETVDFFTIIEDSELDDISGETAQISLLGPRSAETLGLALDAGSTPDVCRSVKAKIDGVEIQIIRTDQFGALTFEIIAPRDAVAAVWDCLATTGATPTGQTAFEAYRINGGIGLPGTDFDDRSNPLEAGLLPLIDFVKGCYVGQEVIARLVTYDKVQRQFVRLTSEGVMQAGDELLANGRSVGRITSASAVPGKAGSIALGYLRNEHAAEGASVSAGADVTVVVALNKTSAAAL